MTFLDTLNARAARWIRLVGSAAALAAMAAGAHAGTVTFNTTLTNNGSNSICKYGAITETSAGNWSVVCSELGMNTITVSPALCGTVCNSYSGITANSTGSWAVSGCTSSGGAATATITQPPGMTATIDAGVPYTLQASASACAPATVAQVEFWVGNPPTSMLPGAIATAPPYTYAWTATDGTYTISARAKDSNGVYTNSTPVTIRANAAPTVSPSVTPTTPRAAPASFTLSASATDSDGIASIQWFGTNITPNPTGATFAWNNVPANTYTVFARATDMLGRSTDSATLTVTVTSANQLPTFAAAPTATPSGTSYTLSVSASDSDGNIVRVEYVDSANGQIVATSTTGPNYTATWTSPSNGSHTFFARAIDNSGGTTTSGTTTFTITEPFRVTLSSAPVSTPYYVGPTATIRFTVASIPYSGALSSILLFMDSETTPRATFSLTPSPGQWETAAVSVPAGTHRFYARATATNGNAGISNDSIVTIDASGPPAAPNACAAESTFGIGATAGAAAVADSGAATYSIPIQVPPGIAGVVPSLVLNYSSQGGNGLAGVGWSLQGLSTIHRCAKNVFLDTLKGEITHGATDPLCLDGQRLIPVQGSDRNGTIEYRTERESYSRIQSFNPFGTGIWIGTAYFKVWTKSGQILHYGWKQSEPGPPAAGPWDDAFLRTLPIGLAGAETGRVWALYKIEDRVGNYAKIVYENNHDNGTIRPSYIEYTGNTAMGTAPFARVTFTYEGRPDAGDLYSGGQKSNESMRLKTIVTSADGVNVKRYTLSYGTSAMTGRSLLQSVQECSGDGVMCLNPTTFAWTDADSGGHTFAFGSWFGTTSYGNRFTTAAADMDGDGKTDLVNRIDNDHTWDVCRSTGTGYSCSPWTTLPRAQYASRDDIWYFADFTGDGKADIVYFDSSWRPTLQPNIGGQFGAPVPTLQQLQWKGIEDPAGHPYARAIGDFNGDGRIDLALYNGNERWIFCEYNGTAFVCSGEIEVRGAPQPPNSGDAGFDFLVGDFNGDGRADIAFHRNNAPLNQPGWRVCHSISQIGSFAFDCYTNPATNDMVVGIYENAYKVHVADMNGDGLADLVGRDMSGTGLWQVCLSKGDKTFNCATWSGGPNVTRENAALGDFNGDGKTDLLWWQPLAPVGWRVCESTGTGFNCGTLWTVGGTAPENNLENVRAGDFNGDGKTDIAIWGAGDTTLWNVGLAGGSVTDVVRQATNGMGIASVFTYKPLTDNTIYAKGMGAAYPEIDIQSPMYVVTRMETSTLDAVRPWYGLDYGYRGLRGHAQGAGLGGFNVRTVVDANTDNPAVKLCTETVTLGTFLASWNDRRIGLPIRVSKRYDATIGIGECYGGTTLSTVNNEWQSRKSNSYSPFNPSLQIWEVFLVSSTENKADLNGASLPTSQMTMPMASIDALGNPTSVITETWRLGPTIDRFSKTTASTYYNDTGNWIVGRVSRTTVTNTVPYTPVNQSYTRVSSFSYHPTYGLLTGEVIEPDRPTSQSERLDTTYGYDGFGNRTSVTQSGLNVNRTTTTLYCVNGQAGAGCPQDGRFPSYGRNAVGHEEKRQFDRRFGTVTQVTGPNQLTTTSSYDRMGRKFCEARPDGSTIGWTWSTPSDAAGGSYVASTSVSTGAASQQHFDALNREVATRTRTFAGGWASVTSGYDYRGRKVAASKPYGDVQGSWTYAFDDVNRPKTEQGPGGYSASHAYNGLVASTTVVGQSGAQTTTQTSNNRGEVIEVLDARNSKLQLQYDPQGNLEKKSVAPGLDGGSSATTLVFFNTRGQKTGLSDPDQGNWSFGYNALGEMTQQIDGRSITTTFDYDDIGRVFKRTLAGIETTWTYGSSASACGPASIGRLCRAADNKTARELTYDNNSRLARTKVTLFDGRWYERFTTYDSMSRVRQVVYPITGLTLVHTYNANGYMQQIDEARPVGPTQIWKANSRYLDGQINSESIRAASSSRTYDALGRVATISTPNVQNSSFAFDPLGNLTSRSDTVTGISETFSYDALNRLGAVATGPAPRTYQYDSLGNVTYRSDIGTLTYRPGSHQLSEVGPEGYTYDAAGNLGSSADFTRQISYWPNGKVSSVMSYTTLPGKGYFYEYDTDFQRSIEYRVIGNGSSSKTNYFFDGITPFFEEDLDYDANGNRSLTWKHYVNTPEGVNQLIVIKNDAANTRTDRLFARDHLGSTVVVFADGSPEYQSFDAWGRRRDVLGSPNPPTKTDRGFTGHEMMDTVGLINMNGRLYDPVLGRMMQADPLVQAPLNLQSYNRYSYVMNNPLSLVDPTGYSWWTDNGRPVFRVVGAIFASWFLGPGGYYGAAGALGNSVASGAAAGFAAGGIQGGNLNSALMGAVSGGVFAGISSLAISNWAKVGLAATAGGVMSEATGGDFRSGFMSAGFNSFVDLQLGSFDKPVHQAVFKAVTGGVAARLSGGSFRYGALTSGITAFITGTMGPGTEYTEQYPDELSAYMAVGPGRAMMGVRPLDNWLIHALGDPMFLPTMGGWLEGTTFKLAHEAVFFRTSDGVADDLGYSPAQKGAVHEGEMIGDKKWNDMPTSSFRFSPRQFGVPFEMEVGAKLPGFEGGDAYRFLGRNCQCFARIFRYLGGP